MPMQSKFQDFNATGTGDEYSSNWAGYVDYNTTGYGFTDVQGTWIDSSATTPPPYPNARYSAWVGIGGENMPGHSTNGLMQAGTSATTSGTTETSTYAWWEIVPLNTEQKITSLTIHPGDTIYTDISYVPSNGGTFSWYIEDETTGKAIPVGKAIGVAGYYDGTEADWITERPTYGSGTYKSYYILADFNDVPFSSCSTNNTNNMREGLGDGANYEVLHTEMTSDGTSSGTALDNASGISSSTVGFTDYWHSGA